MIRAARIPALCLALLLACNVAAADQLEDLRSAGRLDISAGIQPVTGIVPGQRARLTLEIATDRWFTGGTRISIPEVQGLVILQTEQFASNASETRNGQTWVIQRWTLDVFAQRAGSFRIPPIALQLQVNAGEQGDIEGQTFSPQTRMDVTLPDSLAEVTAWVAAPEFTVRQHFDREPEALQVGDALQREVVFEAADVMAMMLPTFDAEKLEGLAAYSDPPALDNSNNRGQARARRSVQISYMAESPGSYTLPAREYFWWDTNRDRLALVSLPEVQVTIRGAAAQASGSSTLPLPDRRQLILLAGAAALLLIALFAVRRLLPRVLHPLRTGLQWLRAGWRELRRPALPESLNPGSSAVD